MRETQLHKPWDVPYAEWHAFHAMLERRGQTLHSIESSFTGRFYDLTVAGETVPFYQIRRVDPDG